MKEYNFSFTQEEADRIIQAINESNARLIEKMQSQFQKQIKAEEKKSETNNKKD